MSFANWKGFICVLAVIGALTLPASAQVEILAGRSLCRFFLGRPGFGRPGLGGPGRAAQPRGERAQLDRRDFGLLWNQVLETGGFVVGDDVKSQLGATIVHRVLTRLFMERGVRLVELVEPPPPSERVTQLQKEMKALDTQIESTLILRESKAPRVTKIQLRGDFLMLGDVVDPDVFAVLAEAQRQGLL